MRLTKSIEKLSLISCGLLLAVATCAGGMDAQISINSLDYSMVKRDLAVFQGVIDTTVKQSVQSIMPLTGSTRGVCLPEYGAVFSLEVNLYQIRPLSPFNMRPHSQQELDSAYQQLVARLESIKQNFIKVMGEHGSALSELKPQDYLTVVINLLPIDPGPGRSIPTQVVMRVKRSNIDDYRENKITFSEFSKKVEVAQF
ncbi:MAG TPA: hypothetical protein VMW38_10020 [Terriglobia bacterium]|nr:hypothetical protein [Terriglobia bacterium]